MANQDNAVPMCAPIVWLAVNWLPWAHLWFSLGASHRRELCQGGPQPDEYPFTRNVAGLRRAVVEGSRLEFNPARVAICSRLDKQGDAGRDAFPERNDYDNPFYAKLPPATRDPVRPALRFAYLGTLFFFLKPGGHVHGGASGFDEKHALIPIAGRDLGVSVCLKDVRLFGTA